MKHAILRLIVLGSTAAAVAHAASSRHVMLAVAGRYECVRIRRRNGEGRGGGLGGDGAGRRDGYLRRPERRRRPHVWRTRTRERRGRRRVGWRRAAATRRPRAAPGRRAVNRRRVDGEAERGHATPVRALRRWRAQRSERRGRWREVRPPGNRGWEAIATDRDGRVVFGVARSSRDRVFVADLRADAARGPRSRRAAARPPSTASIGLTALFVRRCRSSIFRRLDAEVRPGAPLPQAFVTAARPRSRRGRTARSTRPGGTCIPATSAISRSRSRATAGARSARRSGCPTIAGCSTAARRTVPRWRSTAASGVHIVWPTLVSGPDFGCRADARAVLCVFERRPQLHAQAPSARCKACRAT